MARGTGQQPQHGCSERTHRAGSDDLVTLPPPPASPGLLPELRQEGSPAAGALPSPSLLTQTPHPLQPTWHHPGESHPSLVAPDGRGGRPSPESRDAPVQAELVTTGSDRRRLLLDLGVFKLSTFL